MPVRRSRHNRSGASKGGGPNLNWADLLPPPPEHPPPTDIDSPPDSPTPSRYSNRSGNRSHYQTPQLLLSSRSPTSPHGSMRTPYNDRLPTPPRNLPLAEPDRRAISPKARDKLLQSPKGLADRRTQSPRNGGGALSPQRHRSDSPGQRSNSEQRNRAYSPRSSENERGPTPPVRAYKLVPINDVHEMHRHLSDTERGPTPPVRMFAIPSPASSPAPSRDEPIMDRACQSSLPSLINEHSHSPMAAR